MKKLLACTLVGLNLTAALATEVCTITQAACFNDRSYGAECTEIKDSVAASRCVQADHSKSSVIKDLIKKGYELKTDNVLVKP